MLTPQDIPFLCDINSADALDEDFAHLEEPFQKLPSSMLFNTEKKDLLSKDSPAEGSVMLNKKTKWEWPHDAQTGEKLPWGTRLEKGKVLTYSALQNRWPHDAQTGEKLAWGTPLEKGKVVTYSALQNRWPYDPKTGKKLPLGTPLAKGKAILHSALKNRWPYDAKTGEKLPWGSALKKETVVTYTVLQGRWPHDAKTGEKLAWGTPLKKGKVIPYNTLKNHWPHDAKTGKKLSLDKKIDGQNIVTYAKLLEMRPVNKLTGAQLPYGTKIDGNIVKLYDFRMDYTFVGSDGKTYKGLNAKEKAHIHNSCLSFKTKRTFKKEKSSSIVSVTTESENPRKRSKKLPKTSSSCINGSEYWKNNQAASPSFLLMAEDFYHSHECEHDFEVAPLSPIFLPSLAQQEQVSNSSANSNADIEECGLSPSILLFGPRG